MTTTQERAGVEFRERHRDETAVTYEIRRYAEAVRERNSSVAQILTAHAPYINEHLELTALRQPQAARLTGKDKQHIEWLKRICEGAGKGSLPKNVDARSVLYVVGIIERLTAAPAQPLAINVDVVSMKESSGKVTWFVQLSRPVTCRMTAGMSMFSSVIKGRADYHADELRYLFGQRPDKPKITAYDDTVPEDQRKFVEPAAQVTREEIARWHFERESVDGEQFGVDHSLTEDAYEFADAIMSLLAERGLVKEG